LANDLRLRVQLQNYFLHFGSFLRSALELEFKSAVCTVRRHYLPSFRSGN
jgi:hypothetical protein